MLIVHVDVAVDPARVEEFVTAISRNAAASRLEKGVLRFDVVQDVADPAHFVLVEVYRDQAAADAHKLTAHYLTWRDAVADLMARPRSSQKYGPVSPDRESDWTSAG